MIKLDCNNSIYMNELVFNMNQQELSYPLQGAR